MTLNPLATQMLGTSIYFASKKCRVAVPKPVPGIKLSPDWLAINDGNETNGPFRRLEKGVMELILYECFGLPGQETVVSGRGQHA